MTINVNTLKHVLAFIATALGILTQTGVGIQLPVALSAILTAVYPVFLLLDHILNHPTVAAPAAAIAAKVTATTPPKSP